ncbi:MAG: GNAT family N-acetyltransferase [Phycisphaerales bacterium]|nr:GNAT family N-acetyltransferase [Phycisphaerales bacterium]
MTRHGELAFRDANTGDTDALVALIESAYRGDASRAGWTTEADLLDGQRTDSEEIGSLIAGPSTRLRIAFMDDELVACVRIDDRGDAGYIGMFSVKPTLQARGIGRNLLAEAERVIRETLGRSLARMTVIGQRDTLIRWYERRGYRVTGRKEEFPFCDVRSGLPKRNDLYFEVLEKTL